MYIKDSGDDGPHPVTDHTHHVAQANFPVSVCPAFPVSGTGPPQLPYPHPYSPAEQSLVFSRCSVNVQGHNE